ncbi:MAG TPA: rod shape-determining protein MreC [Actinomycetales bacterium]|nr:rod shape-determining protein MreC [Actinomycetales bacterium]
MSRSTRRARALLAVLVVVTLVLLAVDAAASPGGATDRLRSTAATVLGPALGTVTAAGRAVGDAFSALGGGPRDEIDRLKRENASLRLQAAATDDDRRRAHELDDLLRTAGLGRYRIVPARVVAVANGEDGVRSVTIDAGSRDGVRIDMTVLDGDGLVGRVRRVGPLTADVLLVTDPSFSVGVRLEATGRIGVARGSGDKPMRLELLDAQTSVEPGARMVTLGSVGDRPFVPGVPVGEVLDVRRSPGTLSRTGAVRPFVDVATLDLVGVVVEPPRTDPRDAVLPPKPTAAATTSGQAP